MTGSSFLPRESGRPRAVPRTATLAPLDDGRLWRLLLARVHPDAGGTGELFIFAQGVREAVSSVPAVRQICGRCDLVRSAARSEQEWEAPDRVPFDPELPSWEITRRALHISQDLDEPYAGVLRLLADFYLAAHGRTKLQERRGATYRQLAAIGHTVGMDKAQRGNWYKVAEAVPLSQSHAGHILSCLKGQAT